jgi:small subunit ribosomal protein S17
MATGTTEETVASKAPKFKGVVSAISGTQTISVKVDTYKTHPKYGKRYRSTKKYLVHVPEGAAYAVGDQVVFQECQPVSKRKRHIIVK